MDARGRTTYVQANKIVLSSEESNILWTSNKLSTHSLMDLATTIVGGFHFV